MKKYFAIAALTLVALSANAAEPDRYVGCQHVNSKQPVILRM